MKTLAFFNNKGGVGKTSLVYHLAWMYADLGLSVLAADLDPQANLTSMFLDDERLETLWGEGGSRQTIFGALQPPRPRGKRESPDERMRKPRELREDQCANLGNTPSWWQRDGAMGWSPRRESTGHRAARGRTRARGGSQVPRAEGGISRRAHFLGPALAFFVALAAGVSARCQVGDIRFVHDPVIAREGDTYTVFSSGKGIPMRRSADLIHWRSAGRVFSADVPAWARREVPGSTNVWAPDISYFNGRYHLFYAVSTLGSQRSVIGVATNRTLDPADPSWAWIDRGKVIESFPAAVDFNAIDPNVAIDREGQPWLCFGSYWSGIKVTRLDPATGKRPGADDEIHAIASRPRAIAIEGPFLLYRNGFYYLLASFDFCCRGVDSTYNVRVGRSPSVTGPYVDRAGQDLMRGGGTLLLSTYDSWIGPGHNGILRDRGGDFMVHHFYDPADGGTPHLQVRPIFWSSDGWPLAGEPYARPFASGIDLRAALTGGVWRHLVGFRDVFTVRFFSNGHLNAPDGPATWTSSGRNLTLRWPNPKAPGGAWIDRCVLAPDGTYYVGRNQIDVDIRARREGAPPPDPRVPFIRSDANADGETDLSDAVSILGYLFLGGDEPPCQKSADTDDNEELEISDAVYLLDYLFLGTRPPPPPFPHCGVESTDGGPQAPPCAAFEGCRQP